MISMEARWEHIFLAGLCENRGIEVGLIPARYVKPYVKTNKSSCIGGGSWARAYSLTGDVFSEEPSLLVGT